MAGLLLALLALAATRAVAVRPDESMDTLPVAFHSGFSDPWPRSEEDIEYLSRMRFANIQMWEGPCWNETVKAGERRPPQWGPGPSCGAQHYQYDTIRRIKAKNPRVSTTFYLNSFFQFQVWSFYAEFDAAPELLLHDMHGRLMAFPNDNDLPNITAGDWRQQGARDIWLGAARRALAHGDVDGIFVDKMEEEGVPAGRGLSAFCNPHDSPLETCFNVTSAAATEWRAAQSAMMHELAELVGADNPAVGARNATNGTLHVPWNMVYMTTTVNDTREWIEQTDAFRRWRSTDYPGLQALAYNGCYGGGTGTYPHYDPESGAAKFLLGASEGLFWVGTGCGQSGLIPNDFFTRPLGQPLGRATEDPPGVWRRNFASGTSVVFFESNSTGRVFWGEARGRRL